jgi:putative acetyltransferase
MNIESLTQITITKGGLDDLSELQQLFVDTISNICETDYDSKQIKAWTSSTENIRRWQDILTNQFVLVAQVKEIITGFCTLDKGNYVDLLYVHKDYQRKGIAHKLYYDIEQEAKRQLQTELTSDVSKTARVFFEKVGFQVMNEQTVIVKDVELTNYKMTKKL